MSRVECAEVGQDVAEVPAASDGVGDCLEALAARDRAAGRRAAGEHPDDGPPAQGVTGQIVAGQAEVLDEGEAVVGQRIARVGARVVRPGALAVAAQIRRMTRCPRPAIFPAILAMAMA